MGVFSDAQAQLSELLGVAQPLDSGNGVRFRTGSTRFATLYSHNLASGNLAEIAFEVKNLAAKAEQSENSMASLVERLRLETGQPVNIDPQHKWPRVGLSKKEHVDIVISAISSILHKER